MKKIAMNEGISLQFSLLNLSGVNVLMKQKSLATNLFDFVTKKEHYNDTV